MENRDELIVQLQTMAIDGKKPSEMLRYLAKDLQIEQQIELMKLFEDAFDTSLGSVTAIGGWWYEGTVELNDNDVNVYITPVIDEYLQQIAH